MFQKSNIDKLMVVAHPDDECIFGGGALLSEPGWKVICLTNGSNKQRRYEFRKAMRYVGADSEIWDFPDIYDGTFDEEQLKRAMQSELDKRSYLRIVTHSLAGEYGHSQHQALSRILHNMNLDNLYTFELADEPLMFHILSKKLKALEYYQSQMYVIERLMPYIVNERIVRAISAEDSSSHSY